MSGVEEAAQQRVMSIIIEVEMKLDAVHDPVDQSLKQSIQSCHFSSAAVTISSDHDDEGLASLT